MNSNDEVDNLLDDALAHYRDAEPLAGIEERVLRRLQLEGEGQRRVSRWKLAAAAALALVMLALWLGFHGHSDSHNVAPTSAHQTTPGVVPQIPAGKETVARGTMGHKPAGHRLRRNEPPEAQTATNPPATMPKHFPSPTPLTAEERALLALAQTDPETLRPLVDAPTETEAGAAAPAQSNNNVDIPPITIQPLASARGGEGEN